MDIFRGVRVLIALLFITSCNVSLVRNGVVYSGESENNVLRQDGLYRALTLRPHSNRNVDITVTTDHLVSVINSTSIDYIRYGDNSNGMFLKINKYEGINNLGEPGNYIVRNDTIYANIPIALDGNNWLGWYIYKPYECSFQGYIKNQDTIVDWHLVKPYPNIKIKENYMDLVEPRMLYFIESEELLGLDSLYKARAIEN